MKHITTATQAKCVGIFILVELPFLITTVIFARIPLLFFTCNFLTGILCWTYLEYHIHRFWTHNKNANSAKGAYQRHVHHHKHPTEIKVTAGQRLILFSISTLLLAFSVLWNTYFTIFAGFAVSFAYSFFSHWILHQTWSIRFLPRLHRFHIHHHCKYPDRCFGFSTIFWDLVFRTAPPGNAVITERITRFYYGTS